MVLVKRAFTYRKHDRLTSRKLIEKVFSSGKVIKKNHLKLYYYIEPSLVQDTLTLRVGVGVPKKKIPLAVDRNRIKRQLREIYRTSCKPIYAEKLQSHPLSFYLFFMYDDTEMPSFNILKQTVLDIMQRFYEKNS